MKRIFTFAVKLLVIPMVLVGQGEPTWTRQIPQIFPQGRSGHAMAYDSKHGQMVLFGGARDLNDTWLWDGGNWTKASPQTSPSARQLHAMVYDSVHGQVVLFGGGGNHMTFGDTWLWDGTNWTQPSPEISPSARVGHAMAYDEAHRRVILFGGCIADRSPCIVNDTWAWDGSNWARLSPATSPPARYQHAMAYDSMHGQIVLFGGQTQTSSNSAETWSWDGANWTKESPQTSPAGRYLHALASYSGQGQVALFGGAMQDPGAFEPTALNDTWLWDGSNWKQESPQTSPSTRSATAMTYDSTHNTLVLFGGLDAASDVGVADTWLFAGGAAAPVISAVVNGASFVGGGVVAGEIATAFGTNMTSSTGINLISGLPLPTTFLNNTLTANTQPVPLFAVDNVNGQQQINFQVPWEVANVPSATFAVERNGTASASITVPVLAAQPGIFNYSAAGNTFGAILHANYQLANTANPAKAGETVLIYCTGLGAVLSPSADGEPGEGQLTTIKPTVTIGGKHAIVSFSGLAPGFVGLYQINVEVPEGLASGNQAVVVTVAGASSNPVLLPVG